jgi:hypothetical protein
MSTPIALLPKVRSDLLMASAMGQPCSVRVASFVPGRRCSDLSTTIGAHLPVTGKAMSSKVTDLAVVYCCATCHAILDRVDKQAADYIAEKYPAAFAMRLLNGLVETQARLVEQGLLSLPDMEVI